MNRRRGLPLLMVCLGLLVSCTPGEISGAEAAADLTMESSAPDKDTTSEQTAPRARSTTTAADAHTTLSPGASPQATTEDTQVVSATRTPVASSTGSQRPTATLTPSLTSTSPGDETPSPAGDPPGLIHSFQADPMRIDPGDSVTLTWSASGDSATLWTILPTGQFGSFQDVPLTGSATMETSEMAANAVRYMLTVQQGATTQNLMVTVTVNCNTVWFFTSAPTDLCPREAVVSAAAAQSFERGMMIWVAAEDRIYVLYGDGNSPAYKIYQDPWEPGMPESDPAIEPPPGYVQPVRGFGTLWRDDTSTITVRNRLGWALEPERAFETVKQCDSAAKYVTCYLRGPEGQIIRLEPEGSAWGVVTPEGS